MKETRFNRLFWLCGGLIAGLSVGTAIGAGGMYYLYDQRNQMAYGFSIVAAEEANRNGDLEGAKAILYGAGALDPSGYSSYISLGDIYSKEGNLGRAERMYRKALELTLAAKSSSVLFPVNEAQLEFDRSVIKQKLRDIGATP
jgi:Tfp pilus assembly protein PilF